MTTFKAYCRVCTDAQLINVLRRENEGRKRDPDREADYRDAREVCIERGIDPDEEL